MTTSIRRGTLQDVPEIMAIVRAVVPLMHAQDNYQWGDKNRDGIFYPNEEAFVGDATDGTLWVVEGPMAEGGRTCVLAAAALTVDQPEEYGGAGLDLSVPAVVPHRLAVHPAMHGRGLARQLFQKAEGLARECGWSKVRVDTSTRNAAMNALIDKLGYVQHGEFTFDGKAEGMRFTAYEKSL